MVVQTITSSVRGKAVGSSRRLFMTVALLVGALLAGGSSADALDKIHFGTATGVAWAFIPPDIGIKQGIFANYGLDVDVTSFGGDQKLQLAMASDAIDIGFGGGPAMVFSAKGGASIAVAALAGAPRDVSVVVGADSAIKTVTDLKGKTLSAAAAGSLTYWLVQRLSVQEGWGQDSIHIVALGGFQPSFAALTTHQVDAMMSSTEAGYMLEEKQQGRNLVGMEKYAPQFITHVIFARNKLIAENPDLVDRALKGIFATVAFMKTHKAETSTVAEASLNLSPMAASKTYDNEIGMLEDDGHFDPAAVAVLKQSFVDMNAVTTKPDDSQILTTRFVPVRP